MTTEPGAAGVSRLDEARERLAEVCDRNLFSTPIRDSIRLLMRSEALYRAEALAAKEAERLQNASGSWEPYTAACRALVAARAATEAFEREIGGGRG